MIKRQTHNSRQFLVCVEFMWQRTNGRMPFESICVNNRLWVFRVLGRTALSCSVYDGVYLCLHRPVPAYPTHKCVRQWKKIMEKKKTATKRRKTKMLLRKHTSRRSTFESYELWTEPQQRKLAVQMRLSVRKMTFLFFDSMRTSSNESHSLLL